MSSHSQSYTAYAFTEKDGKLQKIDVEWKDPEENQVVVKVLACGVCGSDEIVQDQMLPTGLPRIPGHEIIGDIVAVSSKEKTYKIGDRVGAGWHGGHCHTCQYCGSGDFVMCENEEINGIMRDGGYAEYVTLRTESLCRVPKEIDPAETAPLMCGGMTAFNALRNMDVSPGDIIAIQGIGGIGHLAIQYAHAMGFRTVALSSSDIKKDISIKLGAIEYIDGSQVDQAKALQELGGAKVIMSTAPDSKVIQTLLGGLKVGGQLLVVALPRDKAEISFVHLTAKRLSIRGWPNGSPKDGEDTVAFSVQAGIKCMVEKFSLDKAQEAYDHRASAKFRAVIVP